MRIEYIAEDGKRFDNEISCVIYEEKMKVEKYFDCFKVWYRDKDGNLVLLTNTDNALETVEYVVIYDKNGAEALSRLNDTHCGYCYIDDVVKRVVAEKNYGVPYRRDEHLDEWGSLYEYSNHLDKINGIINFMKVIS